MYFKTPLNTNRLLLLLFGAPGTGKGTYGKRLAADYGLAHLSTGDLLRGEIRRESTLGNQIKDAVLTGSNVGDDTICRIVSVELERHCRSVILDGIPRTAFQARFVKSVASSLRLPLVGVDLTLDRSILIQRLLGRRHCTYCNKDYNTCTINIGDYVMDAILPSKNDILRCPGCSDLKRRKDDTEDVIERRLTIYENDRAEILAALKGVPIMTFEVKRGLEEYYKFKDQLEGFVNEHIQ
ncbi:putative adenylate kinase [Babesia sp. Xinjiang]|uniref:putative adenylate kinase n=1 Tax=Babesia sp. Xinjiang TaxID=462227 RepID=UPI000A22AB60|nr:putative adenylate kinase [Babesia sp. Xinjiang]ORM42028.1 putative adenylate kinase [Babesia sp. Xinjiang]